MARLACLRFYDRGAPEPYRRRELLLSFMAPRIQRSNPPGLSPTTVSHHVNEDLDTGLVFLAGQVGVDEHGTVVSTTLSGQLRQIFKHFDTILDSLELDRDAFLGVQILVTSREEFYHEGMEPYREYFRDNYPAGTLCVLGLASPDYKIELQAILSRGKRG
jgi:enamine deaminase RidA (YjgF/YER057c/UK114 family)